MMNDIAEELAKLHTLTGAEFISQLKKIVARHEFHPLKGEEGICVAGGEQGRDYRNLLNAARKAVSLGYRVYILPNPKGIRSADFIFVQRNIYKLYDLKTISGSASVGNRLTDSIGQTNRVLLNIRCSYDGRTLATEIKRYFEQYAQAVEVLVFKSGKAISVDRIFVSSPRYDRLFRKRYEK